MTQLTGVEYDLLSIRQIAEALGVDRSNAVRRANRESWPYEEVSVRGGRAKRFPFDSLPEAVQQAVLMKLPPPLSAADEKTPHYDREALWANFERKTEKQKEKARERLNVLLQVMALADHGTPLPEAMRLVADQHEGLSWRTIQNWYHGKPGKPGVKHFDRSDWLAVLVPGHAGRAVKATFDPAAWEFFKADYLRLEAPSIAACYRRLQRAADAHGWQIPSKRTVERWVRCEIPRSVQVLARQGEQALMRLYPAQERSVRNLRALEWINGDGYQHNVFVRWPDGTIERPKTWFWQDVYSRKILAFRTDVTEHTDLIRASFGDLVETYGIPEHVTIDNTRAAANKWMTGGVRNRYRFKIKADDPLGLFPLLGIQVHWTSVHKGKGHGQAKPVERAFGVGGIGEVVDKHPALTGAYTGHATDAKPENYGSRAIPLEKFLEVLVSEVAAWNAQPGRRTEVCGGRLSFDQAFERSYTKAPIRKATDEQRRLWLLAAEAIPVQRDGTFTLSAGAAAGVGRNRYSAPQLVDYYGHKIVVRFDPQDLHGIVHAYTLDGRYICPAACIEATAFGDTEAARAHNRARKQMLKAAKAMLAAQVRMTQAELQRRLPPAAASPLPESKVVRPMHPDPQCARPAPLPSLSERDQAEIAARQAELARELEQQPGEVVDMSDPRSRFAYWQRVEKRIEAGDPVDPEERARYHRYIKTDEYRQMREFFEDFAEFGLGL